MGCTSSKDATLSQSQKPADLTSKGSEICTEPEFAPINVDHIPQESSSAAAVTTTVTQEEVCISAVPQDNQNIIESINNDQPSDQPVLAVPAVPTPIQVLPEVVQNEELPSINENTGLLPTSNSVESLQDLPCEMAPPAIKKGSMTKRGHIVHNWKSRHFVLMDGILTYYESASPNPPYGINKKGEMNLRGAEVTGNKTNLIIKRIKDTGDSRNSKFNRSSSSRKSLSGKVESDGHDELIVDIKYPNERDEWLEAIQSHIEYFTNINP